MEAPDGYDVPTGHCLLLKKALYGLKQAGRQWYLKLKGAMACQGHSSLDAPSELNPPQRIPSPLFRTTSATGRGLTVVLTCYSGRLSNVHVG